MDDVTTDPVRVNRELWALVNAEHTDAEAAHRWSAEEITWGLFGVPESDVRALGDPAGLDVVEVGCGTGYVSAWLARRGARPVGVDLSHEQLLSARNCQRQLGPAFPLVEADGERLPLADACFDLVVSEYGASLWCDPSRWLPEAARVLRPGGRLVLLTSSVLACLCVPAEGGYAGDRLLRAQRDVRRVHWSGGGIEYHPGHGELLALLRVNGFTVEALHELYAADGAVTPGYYEVATADWASQWPVEDLWVARLTEAGRGTAARKGQATT